MSQDTFEGTYVLRFQLTLKKSQSVSPKNRVPEQKTVPHDQPISTPRKKGFPISDSHMFGMDGQACFPAFRIWRERAMPAFRVVSTAWENPEKSWLVLIAGLLEHGRLPTLPCVHFDAHIHCAVNASTGHATCQIKLRSRPACNFSKCMPIPRG